MGLFDKLFGVKSVDLELVNSVVSSLIEDYLMFIVPNASKEYNKYTDDIKTENKIKKQIEENAIKDTNDIVPELDDDYLLKRIIEQHLCEINIINPIKKYEKLDSLPENIKNVAIDELNKLKKTDKKLFKQKKLTGFQLFDDEEIFSGKCWICAKVSTNTLKRFNDDLLVKIYLREHYKEIMSII